MEGTQGASGSGREKVIHFFHGGPEGYGGSLNDYATVYMMYHISMMSIDFCDFGGIVRVGEK
jgi:hypothetical protein